MVLLLYFRPAGERDCRPHAEDEDGEDQIYPAYSGYRDVEFMGRRRVLDMVHPCRQYAVRDNCAEYHSEYGESAQKIQREISLFHT